MRVLLGIPKHPYHADSYFFGIGSLAAVLKLAGHEVRVITILSRCSQDLAGVIDDYEPQLFGIYLPTDALAIAMEALAVASEYRLPVVVGGPHTNAPPEEVLALSGVSWVCRGEGEGAIIDLADCLERGSSPNDIRNLAFLDEGKVVVNPMRSLIPDLDDLPRMDKSYHRYMKVDDESARQQLGIANQEIGYCDDFMVSRGCVYTCAYCTQYSAFRGLGARVRVRSVDSLLDEIECSCSERKTDFIYFHDDILSSNRTWFKEFAPRYRERIGVPFCCNLRPDKIPESLVETHKEAGAFMVSIGIEHGNEEIRRKMLDRPLSQDEITGVFRMSREAGILTSAYVIVGVPGENKETLEETLALTQACEPDVVHASIFNPYPGTPLYDLCKKNGWITDKLRHGTFFEPTTLDYPGVDPDLINEYQQRLRATAKLASTPVIRYSGEAGDPAQPLTKEAVGTVWDQPSYDPESHGVRYEGHAIEE